MPTWGKILNEIHGLFKSGDQQAFGGTTTAKIIANHNGNCFIKHSQPIQVKKITPRNIP